MKNITLSIAMALSITGAAYAEEPADDYSFFDDFAMTTPEVMLKAGFVLGNTEGEDRQSQVAFTIELQEKECFHFRTCFNPYVMWIFGVEPDDGDTAINIGAGGDIKYQFIDNTNNGLYVAGGIVGFVKPLNDPDANRINFHAGVGVESGKILISGDAYGNPFWTNGDRTNEPVYMINIGYRL